MGFAIDKYTNKYYNRDMKYLNEYETKEQGMKEPVICLWSHGRRPVRVAPAIGLIDRQGQIPANWCGKCGAEIYSVGHSRCQRCRQGTERSIYALCESL